MTAPAIRFTSPDVLHKPTGYSHLGEVNHGRLLYIAGQVAHDAANTLVGKDDFRAQVAQVFANLKTAVESVGGAFTDIVKLNTYCVDRVQPDDIATFREIRDQYVNVQAPPVSTFVYVSRLVRPDWLIEIEAIAVLDDR